MKMNRMKRLLAMALTASVALAQPVSALAEESYGQESAGEYEEGTLPDEGNVLEAVGDVGINPPVIDKEGTSTWDCIWFGRYWQDDTNGDGRCLSEDTKDGEVQYLADQKKPIKWRVLSYDKQTGDSLLISDRLLDIAPYHSKEEDVTWETSTIRAYLNGYGDYSSKGFINVAFSEEEIKAIDKKTVENPDNPDNDKVKGGNATEDQLFCFSTDESKNSEYGFGNKESSKATRRAFVTGYSAARVSTEAKPLKAGDTLEWWLRSPGNSQSKAVYVGSDGGVISSGADVNTGGFAIRPVLQINLMKNTSLWSYAGKAVSRGGDYSELKMPQINKDNDLTTWDCIWFGNYWQDTDSNGDGKVTQEDNQEPLKWRVLYLYENDGGGFAKLMADRLIDIAEYNDKTDGNTTWENSSLRLFLNGNVDPEQGERSEKYTSQNFLLYAFDDAERGSIYPSQIYLPGYTYESDDKDVVEADRVYCLGVEEANTEDFGFVKKEFDPVGYTDGDPNRRALTTRYVSEKPGYQGGEAGKPAGWWLRSPATANNNYDWWSSNPDPATAKTYLDYTHEADVTNYGAVRIAPGENTLDSKSTCVRPVIDIDLKKYSDLWSYAGTVTSESVKVQGITLSSQYVMSVGETLSLNCAFTPEYADNRRLNWSSSNKEVADIDPFGVVNGLKVGNVKITAVSQENPELKAECNLKVSGVKKVTLPQQASVEVGETVTLKCTVDTVDSNPESRKLTWTSSDESKATVNDKGEVKGISTGTVVITATSVDNPNHKAECEVTVKERGEIFMYPGENRRLNVSSLEDSEQYYFGVKWQVKNPSPKGCVTVKNGIVTAKKPGTADVTAIYSEFTRTYKVTVKDISSMKKPTPITVGKKKYSIKAPKSVKLVYGDKKGSKKVSVTIPKQLQDSKYTLSCSILSPDGTYYGSLSGNKVCELSEPDRSKPSKAVYTVKAMDAGSCMLRFSISDGTKDNESVAYTEVIVTKPVTKVTVSENSMTLAVGEGRSIIAFTDINNTDTKLLSFSAKGKGVKVSKSGYVVATAPGSKATVTVKCGKASAQVEVTTSAYTGDYLTINKNSVAVPVPKAGKKKVVALKFATPKKAKQPKTVTWSVTDDPEGITVASDGKVTIAENAKYGCYEVKATAEGFNTACCEVIVK